MRCRVARKKHSSGLLLLFGLCSSGSWAARSPEFSSSSGALGPRRPRASEFLRHVAMELVACCRRGNSLCDARRGLPLRVATPGSGATCGMQHGDCTGAGFRSAYLAIRSAHLIAHSAAASPSSRGTERLGNHEPRIANLELRTTNWFQKRARAPRFASLSPDLSSQTATLLPPAWARSVLRSLVPGRRWNPKAL